MRNHFNNCGYLLMEDGSRFDGELIVSAGNVLGEAVFNTSHAGYQEILTDPSYSRQIMVFTAPHIGNVGVNLEDNESAKSHVAGVVVKSLSAFPRNWRSQQTLESLCEQNSIPILAGANTRAIALYLRDHGAMRAGVFPYSVSTEEALQQVLASPQMSNANLTNDVTCSEKYIFNGGEISDQWHRLKHNGEGLKVAALDFGVKRNILMELARRGCEVTVFPGNSTASDLLKGEYDGVLLSNGPGDPVAVTTGIETVRNLLGKTPIFGICLGHQLLSLAAGMNTYKLTFGHRGANHPVRNLLDNTVEITSQNHGFAVDSNLIPDEWRVTHINLNDQSVEGLEHKKLPVFSIQYHPEASPGPHEGSRYFDRFIREMRHAKA